MTAATTPALSDEDLLRDVAAGDVEALEALYDRYSRQAFALALRMLHEREAAEEVTQDAFVSVWRQAGTYRERSGRVRPWLFAIVHHRAIDRIRRARGDGATTALDDAWMRASDADVFGDAYRNVQREQVRAAMQALPEEQRAAVEMLYFGGMTFAEIAERTGAPAGTVKSRVRLGLRKLRDMLDEELAT
ncbi:MAG TPA: sigma-70 family RNA polymerase sigma factor [Dehalococcoidia bacterium]|nr:sigma-70 family RNA polymerase sigma factor [Dehalococcoidia bacterium]